LIILIVLLYQGWNAGALAVTCD